MFQTNTTVTLLRVNVDLSTKLDRDLNWSHHWDFGGQKFDENVVL